MTADAYESEFVDACVCGHACMKKGRRNFVGVNANLESFLLKPCKLYKIELHFLLLKTLLILSEEFPISFLRLINFWTAKKCLFFDSSSHADMNGPS